jgi:hypothetical protein
VLICTRATVNLVKHTRASRHALIIAAPIYDIAPPPPPPPPPPVVTKDLSQADLASLLGSLLDSNHASLLETWAAAHLPVDGLTAVETDTLPDDNISLLVPDAEGTNPQFLVLNGTSSGSISDSIDTTAIHGLHALILEGNNSGSATQLSVTGPNGVNIYTTDLTSPPDYGSGNHFFINLAGTGNNHVHLGNDNGDSVQVGGGADHIHVGNGVPKLASAAEGHQYACWFPVTTQAPASA